MLAKFKAARERLGISTTTIIIDQKSKNVKGYFQLFGIKRRNDDQIIEKHYEGICLLF